MDQISTILKEKKCLTVNQQTDVRTNYIITTCQLKVSI